MKFSIFEIVMLICFSASWPISIVKTIKTKTVAGKSPFFMLVILLGYLCGIIHKLLYSRDLVIALYTLNLLLVFADMAVYYYYSRRE
ncbi:MAG: hypothetical protein MUF22_03375 [Chitinispirillaceae bacterium]|jgi:hypothetical protein|nr:hypothetical protein [Chitinispirillaceae bacterium]